MDKKTRGYLESVMDEIIQEEVFPSVEWVQQEMPISSVRDLTLGYVIGLLETLAIVSVRIRTRAVLSKEDNRIIKTMLKRRLPEIIEKIERERNR